MAIDPIHQFKIEPLFTIGHIGHHAIAFTDSSLYMLVTVALIAPLMIGGVAGRRLVPGRFQPVAEISCEFVARTALELLVAFLQAYVFAMLACIYLRDAIHPGHRCQPEIVQSQG